MFSSSYTGIGRYTFELVTNLLEIDKINTYILFLNDKEFLDYDFKSNQVEKVFADARHYSLSEQTNFLQVLNKHNLDIMHFTHFNAPLLYNRPSVVTIHDLTLHFFPGKKMKSFAHRLGYYLTIKNIVKKAKRIITVSNHTKKDLIEVLKVNQKKIDVIYEGVSKDFNHVTDEKSIQLTKEKYKITKPFLIYTGVWRDHKNVKGLIKAFNILKKQLNQDLQLVITGKHDPIYAPEIFAITKELKLEPDIIFPGLVPEADLVNLMSSAEVFVFPSFYEGFGLPPLEAMQCQTPVAASNVSSMPEICGQNNAIFFDPYSPEDMAEKINQILKDPELRAKLVKNGLNHLQSFSWRKMAEATLATYKKANE